MLIKTTLSIYYELNVFTNSKLDQEGAFSVRTRLRYLINIRSGTSRGASGPARITASFQTGKMTGRENSPILRSPFHLILSRPRRTRENPTVAPTILCVPEMGILKKVAAISHKALPDSEDRWPRASSFSAPLYNAVSKISPRIVADTL